jgi:hypothetical protein
MTTNTASSWSESLQQQTRDTLYQMPITPDGNIYFKHPTLDFAYITLKDLVRKRLVLHSSTSTETWQFDDAEALIQAGWAVD